MQGTFLNSNQILHKIQPIYNSGVSSPNLIYHNNSLIFSIGNNVVIDSIQKKSQLTLRGHDNKVTTIAVDKSGLIVSGQLSSPGNKNYDSPVILWGSGKALGHFQGLKEGVKNIMFSENGSLIAGVSARQQLIIWNAKTFQQVFVKLFQNPINILNFKNSYLTLLNSKNIQQVDLTPLFNSNKPPVFNNFSVPATGLPRNYLCLQELGERQYLIGTQSGEVCLFSKGVFKWAQVTGKGRVTSIAVNHQSKQIFVACGNQLAKFSLSGTKFIEKGRKEVQNLLIIKFSQNQSLYALTKGQILLFNPTSLNSQPIRYSHSSRVTGVSSKNGIVASIQQNGIIIIRTLNQENIKSRWFPNKPMKGSCVEIANDQTVIAGFTDGYMRCISPDGSKTLWQINAHKGGVSCIKSTEYCLLTGGQDCVVRIWAHKTNKLINQLSVHQRKISSVFGDLMYPSFIHSSSMDKSLHTYDMKTDKKVNFRQGNNGSITSMDQVKSTGDLVTCGPGNGIAFWKGTDNQPYMSLQADCKLFIVSSNPNGQIIAVGSETGIIFLYSIKNKSYLGCIDAHSRQVTGLSWSSNSVLVSVSDDHSIAFWKIQ